MTFIEGVELFSPFIEGVELFSPFIEGVEIGVLSTLMEVFSLLTPAKSGVELELARPGSSFNVGL